MEGEVARGLVGAEGVGLELREYELAWTEHTSHQANARSHKWGKTKLPF